MPFDTYRSTTVSMEDRLLTAPLKIMLEGQQPDSCPLLLNQEQVARIPRKLYNVISRDGVPEDLGDMGTVVRLKGKQYNVPLIRALNWIVKGVAADFLTARKFDVLKREGDQRVIRFDPVAHADDARYTAASTTRTSLAEDIDQYIFSIDYGVEDIRQYLLKKLCSYPVYASEIVMFINNLYSANSKVTQHVDPELANFIANRIQCFRSSLLADDGVLTALRTSIPSRMELEHLSSHASISNKTVDAALHALRDGISEPNTAGTLLHIFEQNHLSSTPVLKSPIVPLRPAHARRNSDNPRYDRTADAVATLHTINERRVVRAEQDGRGTLCRENNRRFSVPPTIRNQDFRVARGQYLVLLPEQRSQVHGDTARVVCNEIGEVGELFENLKLTPIQDNQIPPPPSPQRGDNSKRARY